MSTNIANDKKKTYGFPFFSDEMTQLHIELGAYSLTRGVYPRIYEREVLRPYGVTLKDFDFGEPIEHMLSAISLMWPHDVAVKRGPYLNRPFLRILEAFCNEEDIAIAGSASSSKTFAMAVVLAIDWYSAPDKTLTFVGSNTLGGSEDRIWGAIARLHRRASAPIGHLIDHRKMIVFENPNEDDQRDYSNAIKAVAFPEGNDGKKAVGLLRGRKNQRVRLCMDELAEMEPFVLEGRDNLSANDDFTFIGIANPLPGENPHRELCEPDDPRGWDSVTENDKQWKTRTGICIFISGWDSPNFEAPPDDPPFPFLLTEEKRQRMLKKAYGNEKSLEYYRNFVGFWPTDTIETSVMTRSLIANCDTSFEPIWSGPKKAIAALDCAWSAGGDRSMVTYGYVGEVRDVRGKVFFLRGIKEYQVNVGEQFELSLATQITDDLEKFGVSPQHFGLDISGDGGKILSAFYQVMSKRRIDGHMIVPISSMGTPSERVVSKVDSRQAKEVYDRKVSELWFQTYHLFSGKAIYGIDINRDRSLVSELCTRQYSFKGKKLSVETKKEMKRRMGHSPDEADCFVYACHMAIREGVDFIVDDRDSAYAVDDSTYEEVEFGEYSGENPDPDGF